MHPTDSEVGGAVHGASCVPVERWSLLEIQGLEASGLLLASLGVCLRGPKA